ncbi:hypothetical protein DEI97_013320 [Curtobacterium sp. MCLR17_032]|uniref:hypothetical protein n=1 Tax=Curtobacterium sp. MCLR17_032 TaxID=2175650 RepID=UPI0011B385F6|nr:hypothetical protein [Curtobacterium sp. MCLR17_032]WIE60721.1 hypothetical protein DEI97_013320 [Curtobacterium sp. MCLR17_032]
MHTVWSKDALPLVPKRFRPIFTVFLPIVNACLLAFAMIALFVGSRVVEDFTLHWFPRAWAGEIALGAILASMGLIFCLDWVELIGKGMLIIGLSTYAYLLGVNVDDGSASSGLSITLVVLADAFLLVRVIDIVGEIGRKEADASASRRVQRKGNG